MSAPYNIVHITTYFNLLLIFAWYFIFLLGLLITFLLSCPCLIVDQQVDHSSPWPADFLAFEQPVLGVVVACATVAIVAAAATELIVVAVAVVMQFAVVVDF